MQSTQGISNTPIILNNDRQIKIAAAGSRKATHWPTQLLTWSDLVEKLRRPTRSTETLDIYMKLPRNEQDELKDVGGFVAGELLDSRRKATHVIGRDVLTLDLDNIPAGGTGDVLNKVEALGCSYSIYSTRKHDPNRPRLRVLIPLDRTVKADEYEPIARKIADIIGMSYADPTTFEASRLMYWPSCSKDSQYVFTYRDKPLLSADGTLKLYGDWTNVQEWARVPGADVSHARLAAKQGEPTEKAGAVGAFCKLYDIHNAIEKFLPGVYTASEDGRYTFIDGSTVGGAVIYGDGKFLYSHHATDPCSGKLVNAFDLVRLHKYGELDIEAKADTPVNRLASHVQMVQMVNQDSEIQRQKIVDVFGPVGTDWLLTLDRDLKGKFKPTAANIKRILNNDGELAGKFARDEFAYRDLLLGSVPWRKVNKPQAIDGDDDAGLRNYLSEVYEITGRPVIEDALSETLLNNKFHPVRDYLEGLYWDGVPRVESLLIDYLGAADTELTRAMTRLTMTGAVARVLKPGCKFDYVLMLIGDQGIGKSSFLALLGGEWFTDSLDDVRGKGAYEQIQGSWIIELGELAALRKADVEAVKLFVSTQTDKFRQAYAKRSREFPRQCIFIASTNVEDSLKDQTGNRRFWPVQAGVNSINLSDRDNFPRDQVWAEAVQMFKGNEPLMLPNHLEEQAKVLQGEYTEESTYAGLIRGNLDVAWGNSNKPFDEEIRDRVCAMEIWCELLGFSKEKFTPAKAREINAVMRNTPGWGIYPKNKGRARHGDYGFQTVYDRVTDEQMKK